MKTGRFTLIIYKMSQNELYSVIFSSIASFLLLTVSSACILPLKSHDFAYVSALDSERATALMNNKVDIWSIWSEACWGDIHKFIPQKHSAVDTGIVFTTLRVFLDLQKQSSSLTLQTLSKPSHTAYHLKQIILSVPLFHYLQM
jgi:hypothetical protein